MPGEIQRKQTWHGDMVKAQERIHALHRVLGAFDSYNALLDSELPAKHLLHDENVADKISRRLLQPTSGKGNDQVCQWLFDTYQTQDPALQLVVLRFLPVLCGVYLPRITTSPDGPLAGFEAVLLALYAAETKARGGRPVMINIPDLGHASLYHSPRQTVGSPQPHVEVISPALEPQSSVKSTKRTVIVAVALELFYKRIIMMPSKSKFDLCHYARSWAVKGCSWSNAVETLARSALPPPPSLNPAQVGSSSSLGAALTLGEALTLDQEPQDPPLLKKSNRPGRWDVSDPPGNDANDRDAAWEADYQDNPTDGPRMSLELELLRPVFKILGHCLMAPLSSPTLKAAAVEAAKALYARSSQTLLPEAMLASRSLIRLSMGSSSLSLSLSTKV
ncbi:uncharacterized protein [Physcomitrium patens]|uniref:Hyccin n=1 Tax=Physcomitrium patens TaxID=3218 RepID=A0A2K1LBF6_PHYPA|nr:uncharacterized protein LOC112291037 [Physcomitrium patens]PNR63358.1 hypothetical protein PHYPA_001783 [Physcomitrium patens]|eukprot:XP_024393746.1 uncharacterized protein LOC112291037 [Physcomitrella patens]